MTTCKHKWVRGFCHVCGLKRPSGDFCEFSGPVEIEIHSGKDNQLAGVLVQHLDLLGLGEKFPEVRKELAGIAGGHREVLLKCGAALPDGSRRIEVLHRERVLVDGIQTVATRQMGDKYAMTYDAQTGHLEGARGIDWLARFALELKPIRVGRSWLGVHNQVFQIVRLGLREGLQAEGGKLAAMPDPEGITWAITDEDGEEIPGPGFTKWWVPRKEEVG